MLKEYGNKALKVGIVAVIAIVIGLAVLGSYVVSQPALRNSTIDYAQGQNSNE